MSKRFEIGFVDPKGILVNKPGVGAIVAEGITVPADATSGYAPGCIFTHTDGSAGDCLYVNDGTSSSCDFNPVATSGGGIAFNDDDLLGFGTSSDARFSWDTTDPNANELLLQMPAAGAVNVPVLVIGQGIESVDLGMYNGVVDPRLAFIGVGAVSTGPGIDFRKARGTAAAPTVVSTGDDVGTIRGYAAVAAGEWVQTAEIRMDAAGTIATTRGPGTITFLTATDAAPSVLTQAMIISAAQVVTLAAGVTTGNHTFSNTITAGADGVGADGEQLTSGGAGAECDWSAAACLAEFKHIHGERQDAADVLDDMVRTPVYDFHYRERNPNGPRISSTGDTKTLYTGPIAEEAPWAMHHNGRILNPINVFGHTILGFKALKAENDTLRKRLEALEKKLP